MDTITQAALGATIAVAGWGRHGGRAVVFGAVCGLLPDADVVLGMGDDWRGLVTHRAWTHSLIVLPWLAVPVGWLGWRWSGRVGRAVSWVHLAFWALVTHPLLDVQTTYGTQLLAPLSDRRFAVDAISIVDPIYTVPLLIALLYGWRRGVVSTRARSLAAGALGWGVLYLGFGLVWTSVAKSSFTSQLRARGFEPVSLRTPVSFVFPMLRHGVARDANGRIAVGTVVPWSPERSEIEIIISDDGPRVQAALESPRGQILRWFSGDFLSVRQEADASIRFIDHRYGMYSDPAYSPFQARLPAGRSAAELEMRHPRSSPEQRLSPSEEVAAGWAFVVGAAAD